MSRLVLFYVSLYDVIFYFMKNIVVLTGAGMSVESGFSTFRGADGLWNNYKVEDVASHSGWTRNPELVNEFYNQMRKQLLSAHPNKGHFLLAELENKHSISIITQNVDNLHERAGSSKVLHLHGELMKVTSSKDVDNPNCIKKLNAENYEVKPGDLAADGSLLRPYIVFFQEPVPNIERAIGITQQADIFVIIGTSLNVYPAASLIQFVKKDVPIYLIDPNPVPVSEYRNIVYIQKTASAGIQLLMDKYL